MSAIERAITSIQAVAGPGAARGPVRRSLLASAGVVVGWLLVNVVAYGALLLPESEEESLLAQRSSAAQVQRIESLPATPFFGVAQVKAQSKPEVNLANIPITQLNLVLSGVLDSSEKQRASALVAERGKPAQRLFVGDSLPGGAELYSVAIDHIVLRRNGKMEKLTYPDADGRPTVPSHRTANYAQKVDEAKSSSTANSEETQQSIRDRLKELRSLARERREQRKK